ncbi:amino acid adenylation domain-containing protein, partial [Streptomyces sp. NPDC047123]|uniref:amino acid adenylation domain-containing protein n=1 Tax=Streptomyces sp. NPDC047123 TaxID=3155622 RepID=UPI0033DE0173
RAGPAPEDAAYVIFSSGSTGAPKGIVQTHRCLANFISWQVDGSGLGRGRRVLQVAPLTFDVSVQEMFYTLASGGCLYVPEPYVRRDPRDLVDYVIDERIEVVDFPQSLIDVVMALPTNFAHAPELRHIISAGETVRVTEALRELLTARPELTLHNHYGPAENHMVASHSVSGAAGNLEARPPVGSLVWNTYVYLLDEQGEPVPDGEVGEIYIGGVGVAIGYTDAELSRRAFVPDPFRPGARLYRTRDRGVWRADRTLQLLGRMDDLIKIRGNAVEPREVEAHLMDFPGVRDAAAFPVVRADGAVELHAALTGDPPSAPDLRRALLAVLPDYMVPVRWWLAEDLPVSPNGKLDRKALPGPGAQPLSLVPHHSNASR